MKLSRKIKFIISKHKYLNIYRIEINLYNMNIEFTKSLMLFYYFDNFCKIIVNNWNLEIRYGSEIIIL